MDISITLTQINNRHPSGKDIIPLGGVNQIKLFNLKLQCPVNIVFCKGSIETSYDLVAGITKDPYLIERDIIEDNEGFYFRLSNVEGCNNASIFSFLLR